METRASYGASAVKIRPECLQACLGWVPPTGDEVKAALVMAGWSRDDFRVILGVTDRTVRRWVNNEKDISYSAWCVLAVQAGLGQIWNYTPPVAN